MHYLYVLRSFKDSGLYIGITNDLKRRLGQHNAGQNRSTSFRTPFELVYYEAYKAELDAIKREKQLKRFAGSYTQLKRRLCFSLQ